MVLLNCGGVSNILSTPFRSIGGDKQLWQKLKIRTFMEVGFMAGLLFEAVLAGVGVCAHSWHKGHTDNKQRSCIALFVLLALWMCAGCMFTATHALNHFCCLCIQVLVIVLQRVSLYLWSQIYALGFCRVSITIYIGRPMEKLIAIIIIPIA